jgi:hypothetical protein
MTDQTDQLEAQNEQRAASRRATFEAMANKRRAEREVSVVLNEGEEPVSFLFRALGIRDYDRLVTEYPPTKDQMAQGAAFDINKFGPALLSQSVIEPPLSIEQWRSIWNGQNWSGGEISGLYSVAMELSSKGLNLAPTAAD